MLALGGEAGGHSVLVPSEEFRQREENTLFLESSISNLSYSLNCDLPSIKWKQSLTYIVLIKNQLIYKI